MSDIYSLLCRIAAVFGPSGRETAISSTIADLVRPYADGVSTDTLGNLIVRKKGPGQRVMLAAHMDTIGFAATFIDGQGFVRFGPVGGLSADGILNARVVFENGASGVVCPDEKVKPADRKLSDFYIDLGVSSKEEAQERVRPGDFAVFSAPPVQAGESVISPCLDNRAGCAALIHALSLITNPSDDLYFVFSVQEEVGTRGAVTASYAIAPDIGIAVDVTDTGDTPEKKTACAAALHKGPAVKLMDRSVVSNQAVVALLRGTAEKCGLAVQDDIITAGGTDAGAMQKTRGGALAGGLSIPCRYIHTPCEMASLADIENTGKLLAAAFSR